MRFLAWMLIMSMNLVVHAQDISPQVPVSQSSIYQNAVQLFAQAKYHATIQELKEIEQKLIARNESNKLILGLNAYWQGISFNRVQDYPEAIRNFKKSLALEYAPQDIHYEYGQALYASEKYPEARIQFSESVKKKFKRGVSLYYIGYISKEMGDRKKAFTFFKAVDKLDPEEAREVKQASEMQIGDIYLEQAERHSDSFKAVEEIVIPQYQKAYEVDKDSALAMAIQEKILKTQTKYDLILLRLRNGRPTLNPPYFLRIAQEFGQDTNVTFAPADTTISSSDQASTYSKTDVFGKYTFYFKDYISVSPEFRFNKTYYFNRVPEIYRNDNMMMAPALRGAYEHSLWKKPASVLLDYDYNESRRDVNAKEKLEFSSRSHTFMIGERFNYFDWGESIIRLRHRILQSYISASSSNTTSFVYEQLKMFRVNTLLFYFSYDRMRVDSSIFDTDSFTARGDLIMGRVRDWFTPSIGLGITSTDPINNRSARGREFLINPSARLSKTFKKYWRANLRYDYQKNNSKDTENFAYTKSIYAFELEYLF